MPRDLYDVAREVTDEAFGEGTYAKMNAGHPDPRVRAAANREEHPMEDRERIEAALKNQGLVAEEWRDGDDGLEAVIRHRWRVIEDDEDRGLYADDVGVLTALVVGAEQYGNQRVAFTFTPEGYDGGNEVRPFDDIDPVD